MPADPYAGGGLLLDVRSAQEVAEGGVPGAVAIPVDELEARVPELRRAAGGRLDVPVLVMCRLGRRAERATGILRRAGFTRACNIGGTEVEPLRSMLRIRGEQPPSPRDWAWYGLIHSGRCYERWLASVHRGGPPDYNALVGAYRHAYGAELNFRDAGIEDGDQGWGWRRAGELRRSRAREIESRLAAVA